MLIRKMNLNEIHKVIELMHDTVHAVCINDYSPEELAAWIPSKMDAVRFRNALLPCINYVATDGERIIGFISMEKTGYINRLFTAKDMLGRGVGSALLKEAEAYARQHKTGCLSLDSSITAEGFYLSRGFKKSGISTMRRGEIIFRCTVMKKWLI